MFILNFKRRITDICQQSWFESITTNNMYCSYKRTLEPELYLINVQWRRHRVALARLRTGSNNLAVNKFRGQLPHHERFCSFCLTKNLFKVEDEYHLIMECNLYTELRNIYLTGIIPNNNLYHFTILMSSKDTDILNNLACFVYHSFKRHNDFNTLEIWVYISCII